MGISTAAALEARLAPIRDVPLGEDAFVAEVQALAGDLEVRIGSDSLLRVALAGLSAPTLAEAAAVARPRSDDRMHDGPDVAERAASLLASCSAAVAAEGDQAELTQVYVAMLARPGVLRDVGADRPVDLHALLALTAERASVSAESPVVFDLEIEVALFAWVCGVLDVPRAGEWVSEVAARRDRRLQLQDQTVARTAAQLCAAPVGHLLPFDGPGDGLVDPPLSRDELTRVVVELSQGSEAWSARRRGFQHTCDPEQVDRRLRPYVMSGRALRWLVDRGVPMGPQRMGRIDDYVKSVVEMLGRGDDTETLGAHLNVVVGLADDGVHLPVAEELAALAWLCDVHDEYVDLEALLRIREMGLRGMFG